MATAYTTTDYVNMITTLRNATVRGSDTLRTQDIVKLIQMLQDASANIAGITAQAANATLDGTPAVGVKSDIG